MYRDKQNHRKSKKKEFTERFEQKQNWTKGQQPEKEKLRCTSKKKQNMKKK